MKQKAGSKPLAADPAAGSHHGQGARDAGVSLKDGASRGWRRATLRRQARRCVRILRWGVGALAAGWVAAAFAQGDAALGLGSMPAGRVSAASAASVASVASAASAAPASAASVTATAGASSSRAASGGSSPSVAASVTSATPASAGSSASGAAAASAASAASAVPAAPPKPPPLAPWSVAPENGTVDPRRALLLRNFFAKDVTRRLRVPVAEQRAYGVRLQAALASAQHGDLSGQYVVLVDRDPDVQALFIYFRAQPGDAWEMIGASPVGTGRPGQYDHFVTPLGVFEHTPDNMDYRAEGTTNENGIRGYGKRDMRIFDFGWAQAERGWGKGGMSTMRFQMHATDPDKLEPLLGIRHSKGCVRIPASLNVFLDNYGVLDAEYQALVDSGSALWVLHSNRQITPWAGRYLVVIDSQRKVRPAWAPLPKPGARQKMPASADTAD